MLHELVIWLKITLFLIGLTTVSPSSPPPSSPSPKSNDAIQDDDPHCQSVSDNDAQIHPMQDEDSHCNPLHDDDSRCHPLQNDDDPRCSSPVADDASDQHLSPPSSSGNLCFYHNFNFLKIYFWQTSSVHYTLKLLCLKICISWNLLNLRIWVLRKIECIFTV